MGLGNRTTVRLSVGNALYAVDRLLHGADDLQGWGQAFVNPDATLLNVRGFDATTQRYVYDVNPRFGSIAASRAITGSAAKRYQAGNLAMQLALVRLNPAIRAVLTDEQVKKLPFSVSSWLNRTQRDIERMAAFFGGGFGGFGGEFFIAF